MPTPATLVVWRGPSGRAIDLFVREWLNFSTLVRGQSRVAGVELACPAKPQRSGLGLREASPCGCLPQPPWSSGMRRVASFRKNRIRRRKPILKLGFTAGNVLHRRCRTGRRLASLWWAILNLETYGRASRRGRRPSPNPKLETYGRALRRGRRPSPSP